MAKLATSHAGTEAVVADTDGVVLELVGKGIGTFGHGSDKDADALLGTQILNVFADPHDGGIERERDLAAVGRQMVRDRIADDLEELLGG